MNWFKSSFKFSNLGSGSDIIQVDDTITGTNTDSQSEPTQSLAADLSRVGLDTKEEVLQYFSDYLTSNQLRNLDPAQAVEILRSVTFFLDRGSTIFQDTRELHKMLVVNNEYSADGKYRQPATRTTAIGHYKKFLASLKLLSTDPETVRLIDRSIELASVWGAALKIPCAIRRAEVFNRDRLRIEDADMSIIFQHETEIRYETLLAAYPTITCRDESEIRGYLLLRLVTENAQRSGLITKLRSLDIHEATYDADNSVFCVHIPANKLVISQGGGVLCMGPRLREMILNFLPIRDAWIQRLREPDLVDCGCVFINTSGKAMSSSNVTDAMNVVYKRLGGKVRLTATLVRKRCGKLTSRLDDPSLCKKMSLAMSHTLNTHERFYQGPRDDDAKIVLAAKMHKFLADNRDVDSPQPSTSRTAPPNLPPRSTIVTGRRYSDSSTDESVTSSVFETPLDQNTSDSEPRGKASKRKRRVEFTSEDNALLKRVFTAYFDAPPSKRKISRDMVTAERLKNTDLDILMRKVGYNARQIYDKIRHMK